MAVKQIKLSCEHLKQLSLFSKLQGSNSHKLVTISEYLNSYLVLTYTK